MPFLKRDPLLLLCLLTACGGSGTGAGDDSGVPAIDAGGTPGCSVGDCADPLVCEPVSKTCVTPGATCTDQLGCTNDTYCETASERCLPSAVGTPCASEDNCDGECVGGFCGCSGVAHEQQLESRPLDIHMVLDRTGSMGNDCEYRPVIDATAPVDSKACYATYALADYLVNVVPVVDTRVAFDVMSLSNDCTGASYATPEIAATSIPVAVSSALVQRISDENFSGGYNTRIEGALRGIANYTAANKDPNREMIGVLLTDGDATACDTNTGNLAQIAADHLAATGLRTYIIGMEGATEADLEEMAIAGGAEPHSDFCGDLTPPCHYWNIGDGSGPVLANALQAISQQAVPLPCEIDVTSLAAPDGEKLDYGQVNVSFVDQGNVTTIPQVPAAGSCPATGLAWYYDDPQSPSTVHLCTATCDSVTAAGDGANLSVVAGCTDTLIIVE